MIRLTKRKSVICFSPSLDDCCQVVSQRSSSPSRSPSWPWLAWESISKCRDLDLNGSLKQSQENKSRGCFSEAQWEASSPPHSPSFWLSQNSFAPKIMNRIPLFLCREMWFVVIRFDSCLILVVLTALMPSMVIPLLCVLALAAVEI